MTPRQRAKMKPHEVETARIRIRARAGFGPEGHPEVDELIELASAAGCRFYHEYTKFVRDQTDHQHWQHLPKSDQQ